MHPNLDMSKPNFNGHNALKKVCLTQLGFILTVYSVHGRFTIIALNCRRHYYNHYSINTISKRHNVMAINIFAKATK